MGTLRKAWTKRPRVGYCFPGEAILRPARRTHRNVDADQHDGKRLHPITREYFSLWFDHGRNPSDAAYAYILLPNRSAAQTAAYSAAPDAEILANTPQVQAVHFKNAAVTLPQLLAASQTRSRV
ncbi:MAG: polysaccharide lyase family 8 super-sandwich domain-containing protein [Alistipes indistinctus]